MRLITGVQHQPDVKRLMIHECDAGVHLFLFDIDEDGACCADLWFECLDDALEAAAERYAISPEQWQEIPDPLEGCQQDWIAPARISGRESGKPEWGKFEVFRDGGWVQIT